MIAMYIDAQHKAWDRILTYLIFAYNTAMQETTFQLLYGYEVHTMLDSMLPCQDKDELANDA